LKKSNVFAQASFAAFAKTILNSQQVRDFGLIEADHRLAVDDCYGRALKAEIDQLFQRRLVRADVFFHELNALLR
jgi:hypothetical protein